MPEVISCPECEKKLRVSDETLGKKVKCPNCSNIFVARSGGAAPPAPPPRRSSAIEPTPTASSRKRPALSNELEEEDEDRPRRSRRDEEDDEDLPRRSRRDEDEEDFDDRDEDVGRGSSKWQAVRGGINLIAISMLVAVGAFLLSIGIGIVAQGMAASNAVQQIGNQKPGQINPNAVMSSISTAIYVQMIVQMLLWGGYFALNFIGHLKILGIPDRRGISSRTLAFVTFLFVCGTVGFWLISEIAGIFALGSVFNMTNLSSLGAMFWFSTACNFLKLLCMATSGITFLLVLRNICQAFGNRGLSKTVFSFLISSCSVAGVAVLLGIIAYALVGYAFFSAIGPGGAGAGGGMSANALGGSMLGLACFAFLLLLGALGLFIWYIILLFQVRGVIDNSLRSRFD